MVSNADADFRSFYNNVKLLGTKGHEILKFNPQGGLCTGEKTIGFRFRWLTNIFRSKENRETAERYFGRMVTIFERNRGNIETLLGSDPNFRSEFPTCQRLLSAASKVKSLANRVISISVELGKCSKMGDAKKLCDQRLQDLETKREEFKGLQQSKENELRKRYEKIEKEEGNSLIAIENEKNKSRNRIASSEKESQDRIASSEKESYEKIERKKREFQLEIEGKEAELKSKFEAIKADHTKTILSLEEVIDKKLKEMEKKEKDQLSQMDEKIASKKKEYESLQKEYLKRELDFTILCPKEDGSGFDCIPTSTIILKKMTKLSKIVGKWEKLKADKQAAELPVSDSQAKVEDKISRVKVNYRDKEYEVELSTGSNYIVAEFDRSAIEYFLNFAKGYFYVNQIKNVIPELSQKLENWHHEFLNSIDNLESFLELYRLAEFLNADFLKKVLWEKINPLINLANALKVAVTLQFSSNDPVMKLANLLITKNFFLVCENDKKEELFNQLGHSSLIDLLKSKDLKVKSEVALLKTLLNWAQNYVGLCSEPKLSIQQIFYLKNEDCSIKGLIHFEHIAAEEFISLNKEHSFLSNEDEKMWLEYFATKKGISVRENRDLNPSHYVLLSVDRGHFNSNNWRIKYKITNADIFKFLLQKDESLLLPEFQFDGMSYQCVIEKRHPFYQFKIKPIMACANRPFRIFFEIDGMSGGSHYCKLEEFTENTRIDFFEEKLENKKEVSLLFSLQKV